MDRRYAPAAPLGAPCRIAPGAPDSSGPPSPLGPKAGTQVSAPDTDSPLAAGSFACGWQRGEMQPGGSGQGRSGGQDGAGLRSGQAVLLAREGVRNGRVVRARQRADPVHHLAGLVLMATGIEASEVSPYGTSRSSSRRSAVRVVAGSAFGEQGAHFVGQGGIVVVLGPVDAAPGTRGSARTRPSVRPAGRARLDPYAQMRTTT